MSQQPLDFLRLIGHDLRWQLITLLKKGDYKVQEIVNSVQQPQNLVSYHLKQLRAGHLVTERRSSADGRDIYYSLDLEMVQSLYQGLGNAIHPSLTSIALTTNNFTLTSRSKRRVLFLCTENSARSQMAEGILRKLGGDAIEVYSAGTAPTSVHPLAISCLAELDIDASQLYAKHIDTFQGQYFDYVITVCDRAREVCPVFAQTTENHHWSLADPALSTDSTTQVEAFRQTANQLFIRSRYFLALISQQEVIAQ